MTPWVYHQDHADGGGWHVRVLTPSEPSVEKWPHVVTTMYEDEARKVCEAHNLPANPTPMFDDMDLSIRARHALQAAGITSVDQWLRLSDEAKSLVPNLGRTSIREIERRLAGLGISQPIRPVEPSA